MRRISRAFTTYVVATALTACGSMSADRYPSYAAPPYVTVATDVASNWSDADGADYLIPNSQIFVGMRTPGATMALSFIPLFGALGAVAGSQIDRARSAAVLQGQEASLAVKFDELLRSEMDRMSTTRSSPNSIYKSATDNESDIVLLPYARLVTSSSEDRVGIDFHLASRFFDLEQGVHKVRRYIYTPPGERPLLGKDSWSDAQAAALKASARASMSRFAEVFAADLAGTYASALNPDRRNPIAWRPRQAPDRRVLTGFLAHEAADYLVVVPQIGPGTASGTLLILDRSRIDLQSAKQ